MIPQVLIVDDNRADIELIMLAFEEAGANAFIIAAHDGHEGLEQLTRHRPTLMLLDINMPKASGFELLAEMRANPQLAATPVIMMSSSHTLDDQARAQRFGVLRYWVKPTRFADWITLIGTLPALVDAFAGPALHPARDGAGTAFHRPPS